MQSASLTVDTLFQGEWRIYVLCAMRSGPVRLGQLARMIPKASKKMLTQNLRELEAKGIVVRKDLSDVVLHIEYELTEDTKDNVCALRLADNERDSLGLCLPHRLGRRRAAAGVHQEFVA